MTRPRGVRWAHWWRVGCGVESLHDVATSRGVDVTLDDLLTQALVLDGYRDDLGWRHHALVAVAREHGVVGEVCPPLTIHDVGEAPTGADWIISVRAPEQFGESTHLVRVRHAARIGMVELFWPQGQLELGERFTVPSSWLAARMTGRGIRFDADGTPRENWENTARAAE